MPHGPCAQKFAAADGWLADRSEGHEDRGAHLVAVLLGSAARHACHLGT